MERPAGVTVLSILNFVGGALYLLMAAGAFLGGSGFLIASAGMRGQFGWGIFALIGLICVVFAGLTLAIGVGLWKLEHWGRALQIILLFLFSGFQVLTILGAAMHLALGRVILRSIVLGIEIWILTYLFQANVKQAFRASSR